MSIGLATSTHNDIEDIKQLIESADQSLYQAKKEGRNRYLTHDVLLNKESDTTS